MTSAKIIILSGPSGAGKTTLHQKLLASPIFKSKLIRSLSATTRLPRKGERNGREYLFLTKEDFVARQEKGDFLESMKVFDNYYGTPRDKVDEALQKGKNVLLCIDVKGAAVVSRNRTDVLKIFIKTPTLRHLKHRLQKRGTEDLETLKLRLKIAREEIKEAHKYDYVVINDSLSHAYRELSRILRKEILRPVSFQKGAK